MSASLVCDLAQPSEPAHCWQVCFVRRESAELDLRMGEYMKRKALRALLQPYYQGIMINIVSRF